MATNAAGAPWGTRLVTDRLAVDPAWYARVTLDPSTQTARYFDHGGRPIEMGEHGTNRSRNTASMSGGGDGNTPQPQTTDDNTTDYESD
ncbi:putative ATP-grasp-modified RiPP [Sphaerisporangium rubeum]|uniref:Putative ATP-grasp target RiPP n=1 Tax=Sphaerisporangium rubeum TaxID=321317 RepID=A0A7X0IGU4_9ACTN|nr:putative ATP-grasp-modified RiPP [Sphaerisporangium rubeum]MBB6473713.1 putative ATP-grasp target RiPP [Sphaerisporangium rubeum]